MRRWIDGDRVWPAGAASWQVYVVPDLDLDDELVDLVDELAPVVRDPAWRCLAPTAPKDLHMTIQPLAGWSSGWSDEAVAAVRDAVTDRLADLAPVLTTVGPALAGSSGVVLDVVDRWASSLDELWRRVQDGVSAAAGPGALGRSGWPAHVTVAYATASRDSGEIQSKLRRIRPGRAPWEIRQVSLVRVHQDAEHSRYHWDQRFDIPLGGSWSRWSS